MGQALIVFVIEAVIEVMNMPIQCCRVGRSDPKIPKWIVKSTVDDNYWKGVIEEMFADGKYTSSRLKVVDAYTKATSRHLERNSSPHNAEAIRRAHTDWLTTIKSNTM